MARCEPEVGRRFSWAAAVGRETRGQSIAGAGIRTVKGLVDRIGGDKVQELAGMLSR
jgi:hypothetical protein